MTDTIVLTLGGFTGGIKGRIADRLDTALHRYATSGGRRRVVVDYPQNASADSIPLGAEAIQAAIVGAPAGVALQILAYSMGAEAASAWLEKYAGRPAAPSTERLTRIILIGNPRRRFGGAWDMSFITSFNFGGTKRTPTPVTQYLTDDIARDGDPWANADNWPGKLTAALKRRLTMLRLMPIPSEHGNYDDIDADAPGQLRAQVGNTRYWVAP